MRWRTARRHRTLPRMTRLDLPSRSRPLHAFAIAVFALLAAACQTTGTAGNWRTALQDTLPRLGHRNFVVVADSAYPLQKNPGVTTVLADGEHMAVVDAVLDAIAASSHIRPVVWLDAELDHVPERDAPGVDALRTALQQRLQGLDVQRAPHENIIRRLDETANLFNVLLLKTDLTVPYTSVFIELQCGYWGDAAEQAMRKAMSAKGK
jgi:D-ribose pyranose/furanose isomerase RbsD